MYINGNLVLTQTVAVSNSVAPLKDIGNSISPLVGAAYSGVIKIYSDSPLLHQNFIKNLL